MDSMMTSLEERFNDVNVVEDDDSEVKEMEDPLALNCIWNDIKISKYLDEGKKRWKCLWCNCSFGGLNSAKAVAHVTQTRGKDTKLCHAKISQTIECQVGEKERQGYGASESN
jgi:hypothetical protein